MMMMTTMMLLMMMMMVSHIACIDFLGPVRHMQFHWRFIATWRCTPCIELFLRHALLPSLDGLAADPPPFMSRHGAGPDEQTTIVDTLTKLLPETRIVSPLANLPVDSRNPACHNFHFLIIIIYSLGAHNIINMDNQGIRVFWVELANGS